MPKIITFIIVTWNNENLINQCLDSIYRHCDDIFEIIVVDNNSTDNTIKNIIDREYKNIKVIESKENLGFAKANNKALETINTKYICYLNPDTILIEDIIKPSIKILEQNREIGLVGCKLLNLDMSLQPSTFNFLNYKQAFIENMRIGKLFPNFIREKYFPNNSKSLKNKYVDWVIGAEMILSTEDAKEVNGFSSEYYMYVEDMDICMKLRKTNKRTYYLTDIKLIHIGGASEVKNVNYKKIEKLIDNKLLFVNKFFGQKEMIKTYRSLILTYKIRKFAVKILFVFNKDKKKYYLEKMNTGFEILKSKNII